MAGDNKSPPTQRSPRIAAALALRCLSRKRKSATIGTPKLLKETPKRLKKVDVSDSSSGHGDFEVSRLEIMPVSQNLEPIATDWWVRPIPEDSIPKNKFNFYGALDKFEDSVDMSPEERRLFGESCFGHFLEMPKINKSSKIINHLLMRVGNFEGSDSDALFIEIGGLPRAFTKQHFAEITGLRFVDQYSKCQYDRVVENGIYNTIFRSGVPKQRETLTSMVSESKQWGDALKRVKFLQLHFLCNVLIPGPANVKIPNMAFVKLVEDLEEFNKHPWGNVAWDFFISNVKAYVQKTKIRVGKEDGKAAKVSLPGFMLPLQVWAYECLPVLTELKQCEKVSETAIPLMRRWKSLTHVYETTLQTIGFQSSEVVFNALGTEVQYQVKRKQKLVAPGEPSKREKMTKLMDQNSTNHLESRVKAMEDQIKEMKGQWVAFQKEIKSMVHTLTKSVDYVSDKMELFTLRKAAKERLKEEEFDRKKKKEEVRRKKEEEEKKRKEEEKKRKEEETKIEKEKQEEERRKKKEEEEEKKRKEEEIKNEKEKQEEERRKREEEEEKKSRKEDETEKDKEDEDNNKDEEARGEKKDDINEGVR